MPPAAASRAQASARGASRLSGGPGEHQEKLRELQRYGERHSRLLGIQPADVERLVEEYRTSRMLRVVLDTNVYVPALNFGGIRLEILVAAVRRKILLFTSPSILIEVGKVLVRKFNWSPQRAAQAIRRLIQSIAESVSPQEKLQIIKNDEPDNRILECARAANAKVIVSGDSHLRNPQRFGDVIIISPREFVETALL